MAVAYIRGLNTMKKAFWEEVAAATADTEWPEKWATVLRRLCKTVEKLQKKVWVLNPLTRKSVGVKTPRILGTFAASFWTFEFFI